MLTMLLGGLWHGAAWTFVFWGAFHGGLLAVHRWISGGRKVELMTRVGRLIRIIGMFHFVCFGWLLFRSTSMGDVGAMLFALFTNWTFSDECTGWLFQIVFLTLPLFIIQLLQEKGKDQLAPMKLSVVPRLMLYSTIVVMLLLFANTGSRAFIYFQF